jgi:hypothetical protein
MFFKILLTINVLSVFFMAIGYFVAADASKKRDVQGYKLFNTIFLVSGVINIGLLPVWIITFIWTL